MGIFAGYYVVQLICAVFVYGVSTFLPGAWGVGNNEVCRCCLYSLAGPPYFSQPSGRGRLREISVLLEGLHAAIRQCEDISIRHYRPINIILALTLLECVYSILK